MTQLLPADGFEVGNHVSALNNSRFCSTNPVDLSVSLAGQCCRHLFLRPAVLGTTSDVTLLLRHGCVYVGRDATVSVFTLLMTELVIMPMCSAQRLMIAD